MAALQSSNPSGELNVTNAFAIHAEILLSYLYADF